MNTLIQLEHPVTEEITEVYLFELQIKYPLNLDSTIILQSDISKNTNSLEYRLYAEDPKKNFLPSPRKITKLRFPELNKDIRLDIRIYKKDEISFYYDPMITKIISKETNNPEFIKKMKNFLEKIEIERIKTNKSFLIEVLKNKSFEKTNFNTKFIKNNLSIFTKYEEKNQDPIIKKKVKISDKKENENSQIKKSKNKNYTAKDIKAFKNIISKSQIKTNGQNYTQKDLKAFEKIISPKHEINKISKTKIKNIPGKIYDTPKFLPAGDKYMLP
jgi:Acetyl/propionyl-CoA carboxylase, alpha subunit